MRLPVVVGILAVVATAAFYAQRERAQPRANPAPLVSVLGDVQRTAARVPASAARMSDAEEIEIGNALARMRPSAPDTELDADVARVGVDVARGARRRLPYAFHVVASPSMVNAFALPGGHVFIGTGLIALMATEDELAAVLAHEIEHIDHYHCVDRYQSQRIASGVPGVGAMVQLPLDVFAAGYSKTQELEADAEGTRLAAAAGYSPLAVVRLFEAMERTAGTQPRKAQTTRAGSPVEEVLNIPGDTLEGYFRSHPPAAERIARIKDVVRQDRLDARRRTRPLEASAQRGVQDGTISNGQPSPPPREQ